MLWIAIVVVWLAVVGTLAAATPDTRTDADATNDASIDAKSLAQILRGGGYLMYPILACSIVSVGFMVERLFSLRRSRVLPRDFVVRFRSLSESGSFDREVGERLCRDSGAPIAVIFGHALKKFGRPAAEVEKAIEDAGLRQVGRLKHNLRVLNAVATVTPLLGLLGTVVGMIQAFNVVAAHKGLGKPELLADGIAQALLTTGAGLVVAIPSLVMYYYLAAKIDGMVQDIDELAVPLVEAISAPA